MHKSRGRLICILSEGYQLYRTSIWGLPLDACPPLLYHPPALGSHFKGGKVPFFPNSSWFLGFSVGFNRPPSSLERPQALFNKTDNSSALWIWLCPKPSSPGNCFITMFFELLPLFLAPSKSFLASWMEIVSSSSACRIMTGQRMDGRTWRMLLSLIFNAISRTKKTKNDASWLIPNAISTQTPGQLQKTDLQLWEWKQLEGKEEWALHKRPCLAHPPP